MNYRDIKNRIDRGLEWLYPRRCPLCDSVLPHGEKVCASCAESVVYETQPRCMKCGRSLASGDGSERVFCADCVKRPHAYDFGYCLAEYHSVAKAIWRMKYRGRRDNADWFGEEIVRRLGGELAALRADALVPVPLHSARMRKRGYNQAADIAEAVSAGLGVPVRRDLIVRRVNTTPMKLSDSEQMRRNNVKNAFQLRGNDVKYKRIVIVDDIYTSGSTIDAVAGEFRRAGAAGVWFVTAAGTHL